MPDYEVIVKRVEPQRVALLRDVVPNMDVVNKTFDRLFDEAMDYVARNGGQKSGPAIALWYADPSAQPSDIEVGAAVPTESSIPGSDRVRIEELPGSESMASVVHHGPFTTLPAAYGAVGKWLETSGYKVTGPSREVYLEYERNGDQSKWVTEVQFPVAK
jgi:effector-binding domain-containing protein